MKTMHFTLPNGNPTPLHEKLEMLWDEPCKVVHTPLHGFAILDGDYVVKCYFGTREEAQQVADDMNREVV